VLRCPHTPYEPAPEPHLSRYAAQGCTADQLYFRSMVSQLDAQVGRLLAILRRLKLANNTLIVFTSDNGSAFQGSPGPFKGGKVDLHEGGLRLPMLAAWPGRIRAGSRSVQLAHMADWFPTFCQAAGVAYDPATVDGIDLLPTLTTGKTVDRPPLLWQMDLYPQFQGQGPKPTPYATAVALNDHWKLLADSLRPVELFDLANDPRELTNLLGKHPEREAQLLKALRAYHAAPRTGWNPDGTGTRR
jgi:arylsulfatase A